MQDQGSQRNSHIYPELPVESRLPGTWEPWAARGCPDFSRAAARVPGPLDPLSLPRVIVVTAHPLWQVTGQSLPANEGGKGSFKLPSLCERKAQARQGFGVGGPVCSITHPVDSRIRRGHQNPNDLTQSFSVLLSFVLLAAVCTCLIISILIYFQSNISLSKGTFLKYLEFFFLYCFFYKSLAPPKSFSYLRFLTF